VDRTVHYKVLDQSVKWTHAAASEAGRPSATMTSRRVREQFCSTATRQRPLDRLMGATNFGQASFYAAWRVIKLPATSLQARGCGVAA
jgi:hypothetical protein